MEKKVKIIKTVSQKGSWSQL